MLGPGGAAGRGQPRSPGLLNRKARRARRTEPHCTARRHPLVGVNREGGQRLTHGSRPERDCSPGAGSPNSYEPLPPTSTARPAPENPGSGERRGASRAEAAAPSWPARGRGSLPFPISFSRSPHGLPTLGSGGLCHSLAFQDGQGPDVWQREPGEIWGRSGNSRCPSHP